MIIGLVMVTAELAAITGIFLWTIWPTGASSEQHEPK